MQYELNILIIEPEPSLRAMLEDRLDQLGFPLTCKASPDRPLDQLGALAPDLAVLGPSLETEPLLKCVYKLKILNPRMPVLVCSEDRRLWGDNYCTPFEGVHYLGPKVEGADLFGTIEYALKHQTECELRPEFQVLIGQGPEITEIRKKISSVADKDVTVLITGETGTGKELIARSIHYHSRRNKGPLVKINCGSLPDELLESEVFGFQKGAFTDAFKSKPGRLEMAHGGTLFIDEIGDLSYGLQAKFLQVLEDKAFSRLGGTEDMVVDTRVVAATNSDLRQKVREGSFRKDLFYRLMVVQIDAPPLRERRGDIELLIHYFLNKYCFEFKREPLEVPDEINHVFHAYRWPGNVRELENVIRRAIVVRDWSFIFNELNLENLGPDLEGDGLLGGRSSQSSWSRGELERLFSENDSSLREITKTYVSEAEKKVILETLEKTQWNRRKAAKLLGVSYKTLRNRIEEFGLEQKRED